MTIHPLTPDRYDEVLAFLRSIPGVGSSREADAPAAVARYLQRNPGLSFFAQIDGRVIGCAMSGHDGRRGYLQHVAVDPACRKRGIARALVQSCLDALAREGIDKVHLDVYAVNGSAQAYWAKAGWVRRDDIVRYSYTRPGRENA